MPKNMPPDATLDSTLRLVTVMVVTVAANIAVGSSTAGLNGRRLRELNLTARADCFVPLATRSFSGCGS